MSKMGIKQEDIPATRVVIEQENNNIVIENPSVQKITNARKCSFQISGEIKEDKVIEEDVKQVMEKTGKNKA